MTAAARIGTFAGAALIGLFGWNLAARVFLDHTVNSPSATAEGEYNRIEREALAKYAGPGTSNADAMSRYAKEQAAQKVAAAATADERAFTAAQVFLGFYLMNSRARVEFCRAQQVDISPFATDFAKLHQPQYERTAGLFRAKGVSIEDAWSTTRGTMMRAAETDMRAIAGTGGTLAAACQQFASHPGGFVAELDFARHQPDVQRALMGP